MNNLALAGTLLTAPSTAFAELRERPRFWFPILLIVLTSVAMVYWYYSVVDIEWLKDAMFGNNPDMLKLPPAERASRMAMFGRNTMLWGTMISTAIALPIVFLLSASYLLLAAKVTKLPQGFGQWFAFSCWASLPTLLGTVVAAIFLIISDTTQLGPSVMQPLSINELVLHRPPDSPGFSLIESLSIPAILKWVLMIIGVRVWSQRSWAFSATFILLPVVVLYGIWSFFAFR